MLKTRESFMLILILFHLWITDVKSDACEETAETDWLMNLSIQSRKDLNGEWITTFTACKDYSNSSKSMNLNLKQKVLSVQGRKIIYIKGFLQDSTTETDIQKIRFFHKGGKLAVVTEDGMTAFRENAEKQKDYASLLTNRALKNNELFEVRLDKVINAIPGWPMGIGVTTYSPSNFEFPIWMGQLKSGTWILYDNSLIQNSVSISNYGQGFQNLQRGDRVGVMRTEAGKLHFFINGVDQGAAASDIPYPVYGTVDLIRNIAQVSIVDKSSQCAQ